VRHVDLDFDIHQGETFVTATLKVERNGQHTNPLKLNGENLELLGVELDGKALTPSSYTVDDQFLTLQPGKSDFILKTRVRIHPETNTTLMGLYKSGSGYCTQCEPEGFRTITYYPDRPDNMATFTVRVEADKGTPVLLSNGNLTGQGETPAGRIFTVWNDPFPKPSYLFALVASDLGHIEDTFETKSGRPVTLRVFAEKHDLDKLHFAMDSLKRSMAWDEKVWNREYDLNSFNIVAVSDFNMGAMENKSLNIFNTKYVLADPKTATDADFAGVEGVIGHEYFHNWSGDRVTCRDWFQLTLKEGLTVFRDEEFSADMGSRPNNRIDKVRSLRGGQFIEDAGPTAHPIRPDSYEEINNFYSNTVYRKGAEVIRMYQTLMGGGVFSTANDLYFDRHDGQAVTCEDYTQCMEDESGRDLSQFRLWYSQAGTPKIDADWSEKTDASGKTALTLTLAQTIPPTHGQPVKKAMHIPVDFALIAPDGSTVAPQVLELTKDKQSFVFNDAPAGCIPSLFRNFSAPVIVNAPYTDAHLRHLMMHDSDPFNQWDAAQTFMANKIMEQLDNAEAGKPVTVSPDVIDAMNSILADQSLDKMFKVRMLTLPAMTEIAQRRKAIDPDMLNAVYDVFHEDISRQLAPALWGAYDGNMPQGPYAYEQEQVGRRALKNGALSRLGHSAGMEAAYAAYRQFRSADNMTDRLSAFSTLLNMKTGKGLRDKAVHDFYEMFKDDALVVDKWFMARAASRHTDLATARQLAQHPAFNELNPNRARSLYGAFAGSRAFHAKDGSGYAFVADFIKRIDARNPQVAAGMVAVFRSYKRYAEPWQSNMRAALDDIASLPKLSSDLGERLNQFGIARSSGTQPSATAGASPKA
jgi:aminopeptidase N